MAGLAGVGILARSEPRRGGLQARLAKTTGPALSAAAEPFHMPWRDDRVVREHIGREKLLKTPSVPEYGDQRGGFVRGYVRSLGITISWSDPHFLRFMAACHAAELSYLELFRLRESLQGGIGNTHPDTIEGPWRVSHVPRGAGAGAVSSVRTMSAAGPSSSVGAGSDGSASAEGWTGKTLSNCIDK